MPLLGCPGTSRLAFPATLIIADGRLHEAATEIVRGMAASTGDLLALAAAILAAGVVTGLLAGLFGIGGGAVIVPVLYEVFRLSGVPEEVRMQLCVGTSLAIIVP